MDESIEKKFVKTFIDKRMQDRFSFELSSKDKRKKVLSRFAHTTENYIKIQYVYLCNNKLDINEVEKEIRKLEQNIKQCYIITGTFDGEFMPFKKALEECFNEYFESILIINDNLAFIKTETGPGSPIKYILYKKN